MIDHEVIALHYIALIHIGVAWLCTGILSFIFFGQCSLNLILVDYASCVQLPMEQERQSQPRKHLNSGRYS